ncbi:hypothetical protein [Streptomyces rubrogriseus]|nr:hypothetical protein [Streptomyces rubrogriseus]
MTPKPSEQSHQLLGPSPPRDASGDRIAALLRPALAALTTPAP